MLSKFSTFGDMVDTIGLYDSEKIVQFDWGISQLMKFGSKSYILLGEASYLCMTIMCLFYFVFLVQQEFIIDPFIISYYTIKNIGTCVFQTWNLNTIDWSRENTNKY